MKIFKNPLGFWKFSFVIYKGKFFKTLKDFWKISPFLHIFFRSTSEKNIFRSWKKSWVQFRCKKLRPFDLWCFQRVLSTLTPSSKRLHYFLAFVFFCFRDVTGPTKSLLPPIPKRWAETWWFCSTHEYYRSWKFELQTPSHGWENLIFVISRLVVKKKHS